MVGFGVVVAGGLIVGSEAGVELKNGRGKSFCVGLSCWMGSLSELNGRSFALVWAEKGGMEACGEGTSIGDTSVVLCIVSEKGRSNELLSDVPSELLSCSKMTGLMRKVRLEQM